jgi:hypothetical protein
VVSVMLISVLNIKLTYECHKAIKLNYINTRTNAVVVLRVLSILHGSCNVDFIPLSRMDMCSVRVMHQLNRYSAWNRKKTTLFSAHYFRNHSTLDLGILGYIGVL